MHESPAERAGVGHVAEELGVRVRHAHVVDQHADVQVLQLGADLDVDLIVLREVHVDHARLDAVLALYVSMASKVKRCFRIRSPITANHYRVSSLLSKHSIKAHLLSLRIAVFNSGCIDIKSNPRWLQFSFTKLWGGRYEEKTLNGTCKSNFNCRYALLEGFNEKKEQSTEKMYSQSNHEGDLAHFRKKKRATERWSYAWQWRNKTLLMFSFNSTCTTAKLRYGRPEAEGGMWGGGAKQTLGKTDLPIRYQDLVLKRKKGRKLIFGRLVWPRFPGNSCSKAAKVRIPSAPSFSSRSCHVGRGKDLRLILVSRKKKG